VPEALCRKRGCWRAIERGCHLPRSILASLKRRINTLGLCLATWPVRLLGDELRGQLLEKMFESSTLEITTADRSIRFATPTPTLQWRARTALSKEPDTIRWIDRFRPSDVLWDVGANVGVFSLYAAAVRGVRVLAFEPSAENYMILCRNVDINGLADLIVAYCVALSDKTKLGVLNSASRTIGGALHQFGERGDSSVYWSNNQCMYYQGMPGFRIDDFILQFNPIFPTHLKIDVDGLELGILRGAAATLADDRLVSVMVELSSTDHKEREAGMELMTGAGFRLQARGESQASGDAAAANHFFVKQV